MLDATVQPLGRRHIANNNKIALSNLRTAMSLQCCILPICYIVPSSFPQNLLECNGRESPPEGPKNLASPQNWKYIACYNPLRLRHDHKQHSQVKRSRSHGYENRHGRMASSEVCCCSGVLLLPV